MNAPVNLTHERYSVRSYGSSQADAALPAQVTTFKYRLLPTKRQHRALECILEDQRQLYNAALLERIDCYAKTGRTRTYIDQCKALTEWRKDDAASLIPLNIQRWTLRQLDNAYKGFFRRLKKAGVKPGAPRFRGKNWWRSFGFAEFKGVRFDGKRLHFKGVPGGLRVHQHRPMPTGKPLSCAFTKDAKGWSIAFQMRVRCADARQPLSRVGIDVGLSSLATLSSGVAIPNPRHARKVEKEVRRRQRALARCKRGSNRRKKVRQRVTSLHAKVANARSTALHQVSANLVSRFDLIAVEKLNVKGLAGSRLAKSVHDASWGKLRQMLVYKAERAGCQLIEVDPRYTSQTCPECGQVAKKELSQRIHQCDCGCILDRDHAAALVILGKAVAGLGALNVAGYGERAPGNIASNGEPLLMAMVYDNQRHVPFAGPCSWEDAERLAAHMDAVHKRSRQQIECPGADDPEERCPRHPDDCVCWEVDLDRHASRWSVGDYQAEAARRTR